VEFWKDISRTEMWVLTGTGPSDGGYRHVEDLSATYGGRSPGWYKAVNKCVPPGPYKFEVVDGGRVPWGEYGQYQVSVNGEVLAQGNQRETVQFSAGEGADCDGSWFQVNLPRVFSWDSPKSWSLVSSRLCDGTVIEKDHDTPCDTYKCGDSFGPMCLPPGEYMLTVHDSAPDRDWNAFVDDTEITRSNRMQGDETIEFSTNKDCPQEVIAEPTEAQTTPDRGNELMKTSIADTRFEFTPSGACISPTDESRSIGKVQQCLEVCALLSKCTGFMAWSDDCSLSFGAPAECSSGGLEVVFWTKSSRETPFKNVEMVTELLNDQSFYGRFFG